MAPGMAFEYIYDFRKTHECGEDMLLPVVNSPRVGMCDYTGGYYD